MGEKKGKAEGAVRQSAPADGLERADRVFEGLRAELEGVSPEVALGLKGDLQRACVAALRVARWAQSEGPRERFLAVSKCGPMGFEFESLRRLEALAVAGWYVRHQALLADSTKSETKVPEDLDARSLEVRRRMFRCAEYHLEDHAEAARVLDHVRPGVGYLDRANDLFALANLYARHAVTLSRDGKHYRADDEAKARALHAELLTALGLSADGSRTDWIALGAKVWYLLEQTYEEVSSVGRCLYRREQPERFFPNLVVASRDPAAPSRPAEPAPTPPTPAK